MQGKGRGDLTSLPNEETEAGGKALARSSPRRKPPAAPAEKEAPTESAAEGEESEAPEEQPTE